MKLSLLALLFLCDASAQDSLIPTNVPFAKAIVHQPPKPITNIVIVWNLSTNWLAGEPALTLGTGTNRATLDLSVLLTNLVTGLAAQQQFKAIPVPPATMPYVASNGVVVPTADPVGTFKAFYRGVRQ